MGHSKSVAQVCTYNTTAAGNAKNTIKQQQSGATNMQYFWICGQKHFKSLIAWKARQENLADYFTKHHSSKRHKLVCPIYLHTDKTTRSVPLVLLNPPLKGYFDPVYSKME